MGVLLWGFECVKPKQVSIDAISSKSSYVTRGELQVLLVKCDDIIGYAVLRLQACLSSIHSSIVHLMSE